MEMVDFSPGHHMQPAEVCRKGILLGVYSFPIAAITNYQNFGGLKIT